MFLSQSLPHGLYSHVGVLFVDALNFPWKVKSNVWQNYSTLKHYYYYFAFKVIDNAVDYVN